MKLVFETDHKDDADKVVSALEASGIRTFLDGLNTYQMPGFYVPKVLKVFVLEDSKARVAKRIADRVLRKHQPLEDDEPSKPIGQRVIIVVGWLLVFMSFATVFLMIARKLLR